MFFQFLFSQYSRRSSLAVGSGNRVWCRYSGQAVLLNSGTIPLFLNSGINTAFEDEGGNDAVFFHTLLSLASCVLYVIFASKSTLIEELNSFEFFLAPVQYSCTGVLVYCTLLHWVNQNHHYRTVR